MRNYYRSVLLGATLLMTTSVSAFAGGMNAPIWGSMKDDGYFGGSMKDAPVVAAQPRFYLRGDIGLSLGNEPEGYEGPDLLADEDLDEALTLGGGAGIYLTPALRADLTVDHRFKADLTGFNPVGLGQTNITGFSSTVLLANLYWDLADRSNWLVPYVGAGIGVAFNKTGPRTMSPCATCTGPTTTDGDRTTSLAAAAMLGITKSVGTALKIDAGYRYLYMGEARTGEIDPAVGDPLTFKDLDAHELRIGVRYDLYR